MPSGDLRGLLEIREANEERSGLRCCGLSRAGGSCGKRGAPTILAASNFLFWNSGFPFFDRTGRCSVPPSGED